MLVQTRCPGYWSSSDSGHCVLPPCRHIHIMHCHTSTLCTVSSGGENQHTHLCTSMETTTHSHIIRTQAYTHSHTHTLTHVCTHTQAHVHTHTHTHTHTQNACMHCHKQLSAQTFTYDLCKYGSRLLPKTHSVLPTLHSNFSVSHC